MDVNIQTFGPETTKRLVEIASKRPSTNDNGNTARNPMPEFQFRARNVFVNRSGETVPPFALMRTTGLQMQNDRYVVEIARPDGSESPCLVNGPREVADGATGSYQDASNHFVLLTDETSGSVGPGSDWPAVPGSVFRILGQIEPGQALVQLEKSNSETNPTDPADPANNNDCCEYGQLFICPLTDGIIYDVLCSAIDPPIDGEKLYKIRFFTDSGEDEHKVVLSLPCTEQVCRHLDLSDVMVDGIEIGMVTYGNHSGCCVVSCRVNGPTFLNDVRGEGWLVLNGDDPNIADGDSVTLVGTSQLREEGTNDQWGLGPNQEARFNLTLSDITIEDPITQNYPVVGINANTNLTSSIGLIVTPLDANDERRPENVRFPYSIRSVDGSFQELGIEWNPGDRVSMLISSSVNGSSFSVEINGSVVASESFSPATNGCSRVGFNMAADNRFSVFTGGDPLQFTGPGTIVFNGISIELSNTPS